MYSRVLSSSCKIDGVNKQVPARTSAHRKSSLPASIASSEVPHARWIQRACRLLAGACC